MCYKTKLIYIWSNINSNISIKQKISKNYRKNVANLPRAILERHRSIRVHDKFPGASSTTSAHIQCNFAVDQPTCRNTPVAPVTTQGKFLRLQSSCCSRLAEYGQKLLQGFSYSLFLSIFHRLFSCALLLFIELLVAIAGIFIPIAYL